MPRLDDAGSDSGGAAVYLITCSQRDGSDHRPGRGVVPGRPAGRRGCGGGGGGVGGGRRHPAADQRGQPLVQWRDQGAGRGQEHGGRLRGPGPGRVHLRRAGHPAGDGGRAGRARRGGDQLAGPGASRATSSSSRRTASRPRCWRRRRRADCHDRCHLPADRLCPGAGDPARRARRRPGAHRSGRRPAATAITGHAPGHASVVESVVGHRDPAGDRRPQGVLPDAARSPGGVLDGGSRRAALPVPRRAQPAPRRVLLRPVRSRPDHPGHRRGMRPDPRARRLRRRRCPAAVRPGQGLRQQGAGDREGHRHHPGHADRRLGHRDGRVHHGQPAPLASR